MTISTQDVIHGSIILLMTLLSSTVVTISSFTSTYYSIHTKRTTKLSFIQLPPSRRLIEFDSSFRTKTKIRSQKSSSGINDYEYITENKHQTKKKVANRKSFKKYNNNNNNNNSISGSNSSTMQQLTSHKRNKIKHTKEEINDLVRSKYTFKTYKNISTTIQH